ncbi:HAD-IA family hydrolase [Candidatus Saccharibacteria bacterium]|nr:HAD-IA family hydrolase [Candidatus Saccharibacteria bacterium]MBI3338473.1 HAD-IA family hydrolase [Candidatus Saccharibacteria bacterium]
MIIVFDFDGTLANTRELTLSIYNEIASEHGFKRITTKDYIRLRKQSYLSVLRWTGIHLWQIPKLISEGHKLFAKRGSEIRLFPGCQEVLYALNAAGHDLYVLSSNTPRTIKKVTRAQGLEFIHVLPSANLFSKAAKLKNLKKKYPNENMVMIGDELRDIQAAKRAGIKVFAVTWGFQPKEMLKSANPDILISKPSEILAAVEKLSNSLT